MQFLRLCEAILWFQHLHFYLFALRFDANHIAICIKTRGNLKQIIPSFDANCRLFLRDFLSCFVLNLVMF